MSLKLSCLFTSFEATSTTHDNNNGNASSTSSSSNSPQRIWFENEKDKKASFYLNIPEATKPAVTLDKPCHVYIDCCEQSDNEKNTGSSQQQEEEWLFGGMEIESNARNIEVYACMSDENDTSNKEEYWQTYRGSLIEQEEEGMTMKTSSSISPAPSKGQIQKKEEWYKTIVLPPSSQPTSIKRLHMKLLSLRPSRCTIGSVRAVKLKGRIPETTSNVPTKSNTGSISTPTTAAVPSQKVRSAPSATTTISGEDVMVANVSKAVAGLTILIQNAQSTMEKAMTTSVGEMQKLTYVQNQTLTQNMIKIEKSVETLQTSVDTLAKEVKISREDALLKEKEEKQARGEAFDNKLQIELKKYQREQERRMKEILEEERRVMLDEMRTYQDKILATIMNSQLENQSNTDDVSDSKREGEESRNNTATNNTVVKEVSSIVSEGEESDNIEEEPLVSSLEIEESDLTQTDKDKEDHQEILGTDESSKSKHEGGESLQNTVTNNAPVKMASCIPSLREELSDSAEDEELVLSSEINESKG